jgi:hypothetical protein
VGARTREDFELLRSRVDMKVGLLMTAVAFGVLLLALGGWLVQGIRSTPRP